MGVAAMTPLLWHPLRANPLDHVGNKKLVDRNGRTVELTQAMNGNFTVFVKAPGKYPVLTGSNINTCAYLNENGVGEQA